jgi:hypothetical protein
MMLKTAMLESLDVEAVSRRRAESIRMEYTWNSK